MGNHPIIQEEEELTFYSQEKDPFLGTCDIYTSNKFSNCFIAKVISPAHDVSQFQLFSKLEDQQNIYLISLYGYKFGKNCNCDRQNVITSSVTSFWQYLTISLSDIIQQHKSQTVPFQQSEIWYILKACIHGYKAFQKTHISFDFKPSNLMINQDGRMRLKWMHIKEKNLHTSFYKKLKEGGVQLKEEEYFSPEELYGICQKQFTHKMNPEKTNIFSLGMTLLHCISLLNPEQFFYYKFQIMYPKINEVMNSHNCKRYSVVLLRLIGSMLNEKPRERPSFNYIKENYQSVMKRDHHIKMVEKGKEIKKLSHKKFQHKSG